MKTNFEWRELTEDGLLRKPTECGPHYDRDNVNGYEGSFTDEASAVLAFEAFFKKHSDRYYSCPRELVLVKFHIAG